MSRRTSVFGVVLISQVVGMVVAVGLAVLRGGGSAAGRRHRLVGPRRDRRRDRDHVAVPRSGRRADGRRRAGHRRPRRASSRSSAGIVLEGCPDQLVTCRDRPGDRRGRARVARRGRGRRAGGSRPRAAGGLAIGLFSVFIAQVSDGHVFGPLSIVRTAEALLIVGVIVVTRRPGGPPRRSSRR